MSVIGKLWIIGVGGADQRFFDLIKDSPLLVARGNSALEWLANQGCQAMKVNNESAQTTREVTDDLLKDFNAGDMFVYASSFSPLSTDQLALELASRFKPDQVEIREGLNLMPDFSFIRTAGHPLLVLDGWLLANRHHPPFSCDTDIVIFDPMAAITAKGLQGLLEKVFPPEHTAFIWQKSESGNRAWTSLVLNDLGSHSRQIEAFYLPAFSTDSSLESFQEVIAHLRAPDDGCPWDKKQTHESLRTYLLEETYEALDALDNHDLKGLREELGDILLQILLHAQIASEAKEFTLADVLTQINRKIVYRHPHVFKDWVVSGENDVIQNWESLKGQERLKNGDEMKKGMLDGVPNSYPALAQAQAIQERAARVGFDWPEITPVLDKVIEELNEVKNAADEEERARELGDLLFALVNIIRWYKVDAESALRQTNLKFRKRFGYIEDQARLAGKDLQSMTLAEMDALWDQAKGLEHQ